MNLLKSITTRIGRRLDALVINFRRLLPLLHLYIAVPFITIRTALMAQAFEKAWRQYIVLHVRVWKWSFEFELYDTDKRIYERR